MQWHAMSKPVSVAGKSKGNGRPSEGVRLGVESLEDRTVLATQIVTIGDSWASFIANGAPGTIVDPGLIPNSNVFQQVLNLHGTGAQVYNGGFYGGTAAQMTGQLAQITSIINAAGPDADIVYLSAGGNDFLLGLAGGGWYQQKPAGEVQALFDTVGNNVQTIVNHILGIRPDIQIVIASYDYINMWDFNITSGGDPLRLNLGLARSGNPFIDVLQNATLNAALRDLETRKAAIAASSPRVHHVNLFGHLHSINGYQGYLSGNVNLPPGVWNDLPVRPSLLGSSGADPIHLNDTGYALLVDKVFNDFLGTALQNGDLSTDVSVMNFGAVRVGTSATSQSVTASNIGQNFTKVENLFFPLATGDFVGGGFGVNPLFRDPTLGSQTAQVSYTYSPLARGNDVQNLTITSSAGIRLLTLAGQAVGPEYSAADDLDFGTILDNTVANQVLNVSNTTPDGNLGNYTKLTINNVSFSGPDAALFELVGFTPGTTINGASSTDLTVRFLGSSEIRDFNATLTLHTDQGAALGGSGQSFDIDLTASVTQGIVAYIGADPDSPTLTSLFITGTVDDDAIALIQQSLGAVDIAVTKEAGLVVSYNLSFTGITGRAIVDAREGNDILDASAMSSISTHMSGGIGNDQIIGGTADDWMFGEHPVPDDASLPNELAGSDTIFGGLGNDTIHGDGDGGEGAADSLDGGDGDDSIYGDGAEGSKVGNDTINGGNGNDILYGDMDGAEGAPDLIFGGAGDDLIHTGAGDDIAAGDDGHDILLGGDGAEGAADSLVGGEGRDILIGDGGILNPKKDFGGADSLVGGIGEDILLSGWYEPIDNAALLAIRLEWISERTYSERVANIRGTGVGPRLNGDYFLEVGTTVLVEETPNSVTSIVDQVLGGADLDWFLHGTEDVLLDNLLGEELDLIS